MTTEPIRRLAADQHGIVSRAQLLNAGVGPDTIKHWIKTGRLIRLHHGVYALGHLPPSPHARTMAAVLACGRGAVLSYRSAAQLWGLIRYTGPIEITAPTKRTRPGLIVHRSPLTDNDVTTHWGIPTTTAARTLTDLAHTLDPASLTRAVNVARLNRHLVLDDLPRRLRKDQTPRPTRSAFEDAFRTFCTRHRLPQPEINAIVAGYEVDAYWPARRLVAELDGEAFHNDFEADRAKDADLLEAGLRVVRVTWHRLTTQPRREAARFRRLLTS
ncbi:MAG TPA: type IV toxin-antitoxin system AbiEi family antitoxin domain-containing protein [Solirubrobacteraceae bacterium]|nr:type IV toxin-antitoxin system AbiEi family antitoxin domain-containing protein [Solirubrobacteraceae bacterium]